MYDPDVHEPHCKNSPEPAIETEVGGKGTEDNQIGVAGRDQSPKLCYSQEDTKEQTDDAKEAEGYDAEVVQGKKPVNLRAKEGWERPIAPGAGGVAGDR